MTEQTKQKFEQHIPSDVREHARAARNEVRESIKGMFPPNSGNIAGKLAKKCYWLSEAWLITPFSVSTKPQQQNKKSKKIAPSN